VRRVVLYREITGRPKNRASEAEVRKARREFGWLYSDADIAAIELKATLVAYDVMFGEVKRAKPKRAKPVKPKRSAS
jgi:hypothetical protein